MTEIEDDYGKGQFNIRLSKRCIREFKIYVSRKWPEHEHGILSLEVEIALWERMANDRRAAHAHKSTVFVEAENKPNYHAAKGGKLIRLSTNSPTDMTALAIWGDGTDDNDNNGNGKSSKRPMNQDPLLVDWANKMGMGDVFDDPRNIMKYASQETIDNVKRCMVNPEFEKKFRQDQIYKLRSRLRQKQYEGRLEEGNSKLIDELVLVKKYLSKHNEQFGDVEHVEQNIVRQKNLQDAFIFATSKNDTRSFNNRLREYVIHGYFKEEKSVKSVAYKAQDKFFEL